MRILIVDVSAILHSVKHSIGKKTKLSHGEQYTFIIYGFIFRLRSLVLHSRSDVTVFALDSDKSLRRELYYSQYKMNRDDSLKTDEEKKFDAIARPQFKIVQEEILYDMGFKNVFKADGYEADDIIGRICDTYSKHEVCIVSTDSDMYQLLRDNIVILNPKDYNYFTIDKFQQKYNIGHPNMWKRVKVYGGCKTDNVPGIPIPNDDKKKKIRHIGEKSVINYLQGTMNKTSNYYKAFTCAQNKKIINRNKHLTILPMRGTPEFRIVKDDALYRKSLVEICNKYGFKSIMEDLDDFCKVLRLR